MSKLLMDKMAKVEKTLQESPVDLLSYIGVTGIEKQYADAEDEHQAYMWYEKSWKDVENLYVQQAGIYSILCEWRFVHNIRSRDWANCFTYEPESNENSVCFGGDTNYKQSSGDYIVLYLDVTHGNGHFAWDTQKANRYITDVIAIYDSKPDRIVVGNRTYHILGNVSNLNKNIKDTPSIYLYSTTDTYPGYDGYYLNAGKYNLDGELDINNCRMLVAKGNFSAASYVQPPMVIEGHRIVERPVKVYKADGTENGELDTLKGTGSSYYIRMILTYASKAATYK